MNLSSWKTFSYNTNSFKKPAHAKQLISNEDIAEINILLITILIDFFAKKDIHIGLKIYVNNELRNDFINKMVANPPKTGDSLDEWSKKIFGDQKFGMILIGLEQYSNAFAEKVANVVLPLLQAAGLPKNGLSFLFFMGNYGFTPFGIHKEATGEDGFLFHMGPSNKKFYTWDNPKYNVIEHNTKTFHNIDEFIPKAESYVLNPGDVMFIPHYVYHIANTPEFSVSFVMDYINPPKDEFENELLKIAAEEKQWLNTNLYEQTINLNDTSSTLRDTIDIKSIQKKIEVAFNRKVIDLKSNGGIGRKSKKKLITISSSDTFLITGKNIFPIYLEDIDSKKTLIFARGHRIIVNSNVMLNQLITELNNGKSISFNDLKELMEPIWNIIDIFSFIQELIQIEAIILTEESSLYPEYNG